VKATEILEEAIGTLEARGAERDQDGERSMLRAVEIFNVIDDSVFLDEQAGWAFMVALKLARAERSDNPDHYIDMAGYIALLGEHVLGRQKQREKEKANVEMRWPTHKCENCGDVFIVTPSIQHCPTCDAHATYSPL